MKGHLSAKPPPMASWGPTDALGGDRIELVLNRLKDGAGGNVKRLFLDDDGKLVADTVVVVAEENAVLRVVDVAGISGRKGNSLGRDGGAEGGVLFGSAGEDLGGHVSGRVRLVAETIPRL